MRIRRSSTSRSIGVRSDWNGSETNEGGDDMLSSQKTRTNSVAAEDEDTIKARKEADEHVAKYVSEQLQRVRSNDSAASFHDELEAQLDGD